MPLQLTNSLEEAHTGENRKLHFVYSQQPVQTAECWATLFSRPRFACPVLTLGSWPRSEADHQTGQTLVCPCNRSCVPMETVFMQSTSPHTGTCWSQHIYMSQLHRSHEPTSLRGFWTSFTSLLSLSALPLPSFLPLPCFFFIKNVALTSRILSCTLSPGPSYGNSGWPWQSGPRDECCRHWKPCGSQAQPDLKRQLNKPDPCY